MKIGFDYHGVIDRHDAFREMARTHLRAGHEVHLLTGSLLTEEFKLELDILNISWTHVFSISQYHRDIGTPMQFDEQGRPYMEAYLWDRSKAEYAARAGLDIHFDDSPIYGQHFKHHTIYVRVGQRL